MARAIVPRGRSRSEAGTSSRQNASPSTPPTYQQFQTGEIPARWRRRPQKQWRWPRTKIKNLLALGISLKEAIQHGVSSKSYWHMARTPAMQRALNNDWLKAK